MPSQTEGNVRRHPAACPGSRRPVHVRYTGDSQPQAARQGRSVLWPRKGRRVCMFDGTAVTMATPQNTKPLIGQMRGLEDGGLEPVSLVWCGTAAFIVPICRTLINVYDLHF